MLHWLEAQQIHDVFFNGIIDIDQIFNWDNFPNKNFHVSNFFR